MNLCAVGKGTEVKMSAGYEVCEGNIDRCWNSNMREQEGTWLTRKEFCDRCEAHSPPPEPAGAIFFPVGTSTMASRK